MTEPAAELVTVDRPRRTGPPQGLEMVLFVNGLSLYPGMPIPENQIRAADDTWILGDLDHFGDGWNHTRTLRPIGTPAGLPLQTWVQIGFQEFAPTPYPGWVSGRVKLTIDNQWFDWRPITFYAGSATDWPTGTACWQQRYNFDVADNGPPPVWQLALRRSQ